MPFTRHLGQILPGPVTISTSPSLLTGRKHRRAYPQPLPEKEERQGTSVQPPGIQRYPWATRCTLAPYDITRGLEGRHIALWQSHGKYYYINDKDKWGWQRLRLFCTTEDQFTQSFNLPLPPAHARECSGANVFTPRERDTQKQEVIVDNDGSLSGHGGQGSLYLT